MWSGHKDVLWWCWVFRRCGLPTDVHPVFLRQFRPQTSYTAPIWADPIWRKSTARHKHQHLYETRSLISSFLFPHYSWWGHFEGREKGEKQNIKKHEGIETEINKYKSNFSPWPTRTNIYIMDKTGQKMEIDSSHFSKVEVNDTTNYAVIVDSYCVNWSCRESE